MTEAADLRKFEEFQGRAFQTALVLWMAALAISLVVFWGYSPITGGVFIGGAASLTAYRFRIWSLRRLAAEPTASRAGRLPVLGAVRYVVMAAGLGLAWLLADQSGDNGYLFAAAGMLFLGNVAVVVQAVWQMRRNTGS